MSACGDDAPKSYPRNCIKGGNIPLLIEPFSMMIYYPNYEDECSVCTSKYFCSCGNELIADEAVDEINYIVEKYQVLVTEIKSMDKSIEHRNKLTKVSYRTYIEQLITDSAKKIGFAVGLISDIIQAIASFIF